MASLLRKIPGKKKKKKNLGSFKHAKGKRVLLKYYGAGQKGIRFIAAPYFKSSTLASFTLTSSFGSL